MVKGWVEERNRTDLKRTSTNELLVTAGRRVSLDLEGYGSVFNQTKGRVRSAESKEIKRRSDVRRHSFRNFLPCLAVQPGSSSPFPTNALLNCLPDGQPYLDESFAPAR